jgi:hypothetical protein
MHAHKGENQIAATSSRLFEHLGGKEVCPQSRVTSTVRNSHLLDSLLARCLFLDIMHQPNNIWGYKYGEYDGHDRKRNNPETVSNTVSIKRSTTGEVVHTRYQSGEETTWPGNSFPT